MGSLVRRTSAPVLPVYFPGSNSIFFQLIGLIYGELQNFVVVSEFNKMPGRRLKPLIGEVIQPMNCLYGFGSKSDKLPSGTHVRASIRYRVSRLRSNHRRG